MTVKGSGDAQYCSPLSKIAGNLLGNRMVTSMACKSHLSFRAAQKFLFKYIYKMSVGDYVTKLEASNSTSKNKFQIIAY